MKKKDRREGILLATPVGALFVAATMNGVSRIDFLDEPIEVILPTVQKTQAVLIKATEQLQSYFAGKSAVFTVPLDLEGTEFQQTVWKALGTIPFGKTVSYKTIGDKIKNPKAVRAIGQANGRNPVPIIVPCHRVVAHSGALGGYSSGLPRKKWLLRHEGITTWE